MRKRRKTGAVSGAPGPMLPWSRRVTLAVLLSGLVPLVVMWSVTYLLAQTSLRDRMFEHLESVAAIQESRIRNLALQNVQKLRLVSSRSQLRWSLESFLESGTPEARGRMDVILKDLVDASTWLEEVFVADPDGRIVAGSNGDRLGGDVSGKRYFRSGMERVFMDLFPHPDTREPSMISSGPLELEGQQLGTVVLLQSSEQLFSITGDFAGLGRTGESILARRTGEGSGVYLTPLRFDRRAALDRTVHDDAPMARVFATRAEGRTKSTKDYRGEPVIAVTRYIPEVDWGLVVKMDRDEVFAPADALGKTLFLVLVAGTLILSLIGVYLGRTMGGTARRLEKSEERFRSVAQYAADAIVTADAYGTIETWNQGAEEMFGFPEDEVIGRKVSMLMPDRFRPRHEKGLIRAREKNEFRIVGERIEVAGQHRDGWEFPIEICVNAWRADGRMYFGAVIRDISERKRAEAALNESKEAAEAANRELEAFSYSVSHDLRVPLRSMHGFSRFLEEKYSDRLDSRGKHYLERIREGANRMGALIDSLLDFSRVGKQSLKKEELDPEPLIRETFETLCYDLDPTRIDFRVGRLPACTADPDLLRHVFMNLLSNALKFTRDRDTARIEVGYSEGAFYVSDNGIGFDPRYTDKLFRVFQRLHSADEFKGTGIGLALAHRIIERHGGRMWAEAEEGVGAVFRLTIPGTRDAAVDTGAGKSP